MKLNMVNHGYNKALSFGVRMPLCEATVHDVKTQGARMAQSLVVCEEVHMLMADKIKKTDDSYTILGLLGQMITDVGMGVSESLMKAVTKSGKSVKQAFCETCDKLFDVQLYDEKTNPDLVDGARKRIRRAAHFTTSQKKAIIASYIEMSDKFIGMDCHKAVQKHLKKDLNIGCSVHTIGNYSSSITAMLKHYKDFKSLPNNNKKTLTMFHNYVQDNDERSYTKPVFGNFEIFKFVIDKFNEKYPHSALKFEEEK